ncbi:MAG: alpha/beta fold hydrolase [Chloroflexi bacterium]|nr:alpha/beta fold hydrolase [Chloroflexota bacterium]
MKYRLNLIRFGLFSFLVLFSLGLGIFSYNLAMDYVHPRRLIPPSGEELVAAGIEYRDVEIISHDGLRLSGWYTPPENGVVILVAHGHADVRPLDFYKLFAEQGYGVLAWDFRAHGQSEGDRVTLGYLESRDVESALDFALAQPNVEHIGAWGGSIGGVSVLLAAARREEIEAVIIDSAFPTLEDELDDQIPFLMRGLIRFFAEKETGMKVSFVRPVDVIGEISPRPVFIIQGMGDTRIPENSAQRLYDAAGEPRWLWTEEEPVHMNMFSYYRMRYTKRTSKFFREFLLE